MNEGLVVEMKINSIVESKKRKVQQLPKNILRKRIRALVGCVQQWPPLHCSYVLRYEERSVLSCASLNRFISTYKCGPNGTENIQFHVCFVCLYVHTAYLHGSRNGSLVPGVVNEAKDILEGDKAVAFKK